MALALLTLCFGVLALGFGRHAFAKIRTERAWPTVPGVPVHYDPRDPSRSFLVTNPMSTIWLLFGSGVFVILFGLGQLLVVVAGTAK